MYKLFPAIDVFIEKAELRFGKVIIAVFVGFIFLFLASIFSAIRLETFYHGNGFTRLSVNPYETTSENDLRFRILSPLLGHLLFLRGPAFKYFMLIILALFFGAIYFYQRKEKLFPTEAIGLTALCVFSTLSFYQLYFPAYTDPLSFLLILLFMFNYRNIYYATLLLTLMLFNHENTLFLFPFFFLLIANGNFKPKNLLKITLYFLTALIPYIIFRKIISSQAEIAFNVSYYFDPHNMQWTREHVIPHLLSGFFQAFRLFWVFPLLAISINIYQRRHLELILIIVVIVFVLTQLAIAWDISRLIGMAFPAILISARRVREYFGTTKFLWMIYTVILINFFIPAYCIGALDPIPYTPFWLK